MGREMFALFRAGSRSAEQGASAFPDFDPA